MRNRVRLLLLLITLLLAGCAGTPPPPEEPVAPPAVKRTQGFVGDAFRLIAGGSPESLREGFAVLDSRDGLSDYAEDLRFLASWLYNELYPALPETIPRVTPLPSSEFAPVLKDIKDGVYPLTRIEEVSYLFFILPSLSLLYTDEPDTLEIAYESLTVGRELNPAGVLPQYMLGYVEELRGNRAEAITWYIGTLQASINCYPAAYGLVRVYLDEGRYEEADLVLSDLRELIGEETELLYLQGRVDLALRRLRSAADNFEAAREQDGPEARYLLGEAEAQFRLGENEAAWTVLREARQRGIDSVSLVLLEAKILRAQGQRLRALSLLQRYVERFPDEQSIQDLYGQLLIETGRDREGQALLSSSVSSAEEAGARNRELMQNAVDAGLWEEARIYLEEALDEVRDAALLEQGAEIYRRIGLEEERLGVLLELRELRPGDASSALELIDYYLGNGEPGEARIIIESLDQERLSAEELSSLRIFQSRLLADGPERRRLLEEALFLDIRNPEAPLALAEFYLRRGDSARAEIYLRQVERMPQLEPELTERLEALRIESP